MLPPLALSTAALVAANLITLGGALLGIWSAYDLLLLLLLLLLLFWAENVVVGLFHVLRLGAVMVLRRAGALAVLIPFFMVHYGMFTFVHGHFIVGLMAPRGEAELEHGIALLLSPEGLLGALLALVASHGVSFVVNFLGGGEWRSVEPTRRLVQPYARVVVLHLVIIAGGAITLALGEPLAALVLLVVLKIGADIIAHRREHRAAAQES